MYSLLLAVIYLAFISLGLPDSLLGSAWPVMHLDIGAPTAFMGMVSMVISGGTIVSSLLSDKLTKKFGTVNLTIGSVFLTAIALFGFSISTEFWMLLIFAIPYGVGAGAVDAALNNYVSLHYSSRHMSWLHSFWGVGAIISPFVMSYAIQNTTWNNGYSTVSFIQLAIVAVLVLSLPLWKTNGSAKESNGKSLSLMEALKINGVIYIVLGFLAYCALEATTMYWASTYLVEVRGLSGGIAARFGSLFYIGLTASRIISGFVTDKLGDRKMIQIGTTILIIGMFGLLIPVENPIYSLIGFIIIGFGSGPIYPAIIHSTPGNFGKENSGAIIGIQMAFAYVGSTLVPPLYGLLGSFLGYKILPVFVLVCAVFMISMTEMAFKVTAKKEV